MECKFCGSVAIRWGTRRNRQKWRCKSCGKHFTFGEKRIKKEKVLEFNFSLGYVVGVLVGDGSLSRCKDYHYFDGKNRQVPKRQAIRRVPRFRYSFQLQCKDEDFAKAFAEHFGRVTEKKATICAIQSKPVTVIAGNVLRKPYVFHGFKVQSISKEWYEKIKPLVIDLSWIHSCGQEVKIGYLRGFYDSEGGVDKRPRVHLTNKNEALLILAKNLLAELGIMAHLCKMKNMGRLWIHSKDNVRKFFELVGFSIYRKKRVFVD